MIVFALSALLCSLAFVLVAGQNGLLEYYNLKKEMGEASARNQRLSDRNHRLLKDVVDIKSRVEAIEELARNSLGMIHKGEVFYHVIER